MDSNKKIVPNDVFRFRLQLISDLEASEICIYTKPFPPMPLSIDEDEYDKIIREEEKLVQEKYFTKKRIDQLKEELIKKIQESENPFEIYCVDRDGGYNVTEEQLFKF